MVLCSNYLFGSNVHVSFDCHDNEYMCVFLEIVVFLFLLFALSFTFPIYIVLGRKLLLALFSEVTKLRNIIVLAS